jgi:hypothetical protein
MRFFIKSLYLKQEIYRIFGFFILIFIIPNLRIKISRIHH